MRRRSLLIGGGATLVALVAGGAAVWSQVPPIPKRPNPDSDAALAWIEYVEGRYRLTVPRAEMGQNISTAMKQIACTELQAGWDEVDIALHDTMLAGVKPTVGSESVQLFTEPLAQACAALREAVSAGRTSGVVTVENRAREDLLIFTGPRSGSFIGTSPRIEQGQEIVTGRPLYAGDVRLPNQLFGRVLRATAPADVASAPEAWDETAARKVSGFVAIVEECGPNLGQSQGLGIVASRPGALDRIADALDIRWTTAGTHPSANWSDAIDVDRRLTAGDLPHIIMDGSPADGAWDVDLRIDIPFEAHAPIEPRSAVAQWTDGQLKVWAGTQDAFYVRDVLADHFGLANDGVTVQSMRIGGGFGGKTICTVEAEAAALARAIGQPVKVQWTRSQEFAQAFHRPPSSHRIRGRLANGRLTDWSHAQVSSHIMFTAAVVPGWMQSITDTVAGDGGVARGMAVPYTITRARSAYDTVRLPVHTGPWRSLGAASNALATESAIDELAIAAGIDPLQFRLDHIADERLLGVLERVARMSGWAKRGNRALGVGCGIYKGVSYAAVVAEVEVNDGIPKVIAMWCAHDCGLVVNPDQVRAQCEGNMVWSLGMVFQGILPMDVTGAVTAQTFADAPIPTIANVPPMAVELIESNAPPTGAGETAMVAAPGALANAFRTANGTRPTRFPIRPA